MKLLKCNIIIICLIIVYFLTKSGASQNIEYNWIFHGGGLYDDYGEAVDILDNGNSFITGRFTNLATFGDFQLVSNGSTIFLSLMNQQGIIKWIKSFGDSGLANLKKIKSDDNGNIIAIGSFWFTLTLEDTILTSNGSRDMFFVKFDSSGQLLLNKQAGGVDNDTGDDITIDSNGNIIIMGIFENTAVFDDTTIISNNQTSYFVAKYDLGKVNLSYNLQFACKYKHRFK